MFWSVIAGFFAVALALAALVGLVQSLKRYPRDRRIVDMRNRGLSVCEIAEALGTTDSDVRESLTRIASEVGPTGEVG
jgi:DNA-binding NarL/FixJ family response regulator